MESRSYILLWRPARPPFRLLHTSLLELSCRHKYTFLHINILNCIDQDEYKIRGRGPTSEDNLHSIYYTYIYRHYAEIEHLSEYIGNLYIILCINAKKYIRSSFLPGTALWGKRRGGRVGISSCTYNGGNIFYNILNIEYRQRVSHYKNHYKTKRSHRLRWSKYACVLSNCLSRFFAYFC